MASGAVLQAELPPQSQLQRATTLERASTNLTLIRAGTLSTEDADLRHAAVMPTTFDIESDRPFCGGMWKLQQMFGFVLGIGVLLGAWLAEPIPTEYSKANEMFGITMLCCSFWVFEVLPVYITALIPLVLMPLFKITSSPIAAQAYWNPIQMLVVGTYLVDIALEQVKLPHRCALKMLMCTNVVQPGLVLFIFMFVSWLLSIFCNNIAVTIMITPFAIGLLNAAQMKELDDVSHESGSEDSEEEVHTRVKEVDTFSRGVLVGIAFSASAGGMASVIGCVPNELLMAMDGVRDHVNFADFMEFAYPVSVLTFVISYISVYFRYAAGIKGKIITRDLVEEEYEALVGEIGPFGWDEAAVGLVQILQFLLLLFRPLLARLMVNDLGAQLLGDSTLACLPVCLLFLIPSNVNRGSPVLTWPVVQEKFDFGLILLIGGGFAISSGFSQSGLSVALGDGMAHMMETWSAVVCTFVMMLLAAISVQLFSAVGTATTVLPALQSAALNAVRNPLGFLLPATLACSFGFSLPTATPSNVVVLAKSWHLGSTAHLRVRDFLLTGLPVQVVMSTIGMLFTYAMANFVFDAYSPFPQWACDGVTSIWANVSGVVDGVKVTHQACVLDVDPDMSRCKLANGTMVAFASVYNMMAG